MRPLQNEEGMFTVTTAGRVPGPFEVQHPGFRAFPV
jgi:hypothetical protein